MSNLPWGGAVRVFTSSKSLYDELSDKLNIELKDLFQIAVAVGINSGSEPEAPGKKRDELTNCYSIDKQQVLESLLQAMYPTEHPSQLITLLEGYGEVGIKKIYKDWELAGNFEIMRYSTKVGESLNEHS